MKQLILLLIFVFLLLAGCEKKITEKELNNDLNTLRAKSVLLCKEKNMEYVGLEMVTLEQSKAICMINSPPKIYKYGVEE